MLCVQNMMVSLADSGKNAFLSHEGYIPISRLDVTGGVLAEQYFAANLDINVNILTNSQNFSYQRFLNWFCGARTQQQTP